MIDKIKFGKRMTSARKAKGLSRVQLAVELELDDKTIGHYERGTRMPGLDRLLRICEILSVSFDYLFQDSLPEGLHNPDTKEIDEIMLFLSPLEREILLDNARALYSNKGKYDNFSSE